MALPSRTTTRSDCGRASSSENARARKTMKSAGPPTAMAPKEGGGGNEPFPLVFFLLPLLLPPDDSRSPIALAGTAETLAGQAP